MSSENRADLPKPDTNDDLPPESIPVDKSHENKNSPSTHSSLEIGEGDVSCSTDNIKKDPLDQISTEKGDEIVLGIEEGNSDEDLHLEWDEDEDIEEDIISLHLPEDATEVQASYAAPVSNNLSEIDKTPKQAIEDKIDRDVIDITDLSSPISGEIETQSNLDDSHIKEKVVKIEEDVMKNDDNTITIFDVDDNAKVDESFAANVVDDDDLIIIEDDNDDIEDTITNPDEKLELDETKESKEKIDVVLNNDAIPETPNNSLVDTSPTESNLDHGLNKPDMMLEIPTQEIIDCLDDSDISYTNISIDQDSQNSQDMKEKPKPVDESVKDIEEEPNLMQENKTIDNIEHKDKTNDGDVILQNKLMVDVNKQLEVTVKPANQTDSESCVNENKKRVAENKEIISNITTNENKRLIEDIPMEEVEKTDLKNTKEKIVTEHATIDTGLTETYKKDLNTEQLINIEEIKGIAEKTIDSNDVSMELEVTNNETDSEIPQPSTSKDKSELDNDKTLLNDVLNSSDNKQVSISGVINSDENLPEPEQELESQIGDKEMSELQMSIDEEVAEPAVAPADDGTNDVMSKVTETVNEKPSTSQDKFTSEPPRNMSDDKIPIELPNEKSVTEDLQVPPTSGTMDQATDSNDEVPEMSDSLGLLAESSRVIEDDEEPEDEDEDEDDFDHDESSNQMTAEHSEDSNAQHSETDGPKDQEEKGVETPQEQKDELNFAISDVAGEVNLEKEGEVTEDVCEEGETIAADKTVEESATTEPVLDAEVENKEYEKDTSKPTSQAMDVETVKLSDTSDTEVEETNPSILMSLLKDKQNKEGSEKPVDEVKKSTSKTLDITKPATVLNYVDLEESSDDDTQEVNKKSDTDVEGSDLIVCADIEVSTSSPVENSETNPSKINRTTRINTSEVTIKTTTTTEPTLVIPEAKLPEEKPKLKFSLEIFNLDSDEEDTPALDPTPEPTKLTTAELDKARETNKCVNLACTSDSKTDFYPADMAIMAFYDAKKKKKAMVCANCISIFAKRTEELISGIKNLAPLLDLGIVKESSDLVEISDSDSDEGTESGEDHAETIGEEGAAMLEHHLRDVINETWRKFKLDFRLSEAEDSLNKEMKKLEEESKEIDSLLKECQTATDKLRNDLYATFEHERHELAPLVIFDTPLNKSSSKRSLSSGPEPPAKKAAIPLGYTPLEHDTKDAASGQQDKSTPAVPDTSKQPAVDDDKDIAVLKVSAESAPSDLPPLGEPNLPPLKPGMVVFAMRNTFRSWVRSTILECQGKNVMPGSTHNFMMCRVKVDLDKGRSPIKLLPARWLAYNEPSNARMTIGTRVIALFKDGEEHEQKRTFFSGIIAEVPNPVNNYRYLVFFDDGYAQYVRHADTRLVCESSPLVWEEVHPLSREFVRKYLVAYPERPMVRLHAGQSLKTEWNGKWWPSRVVQVDASLVKVFFEEDNRSEWIYRGSTRLAPLYLELQAAERHRARPMPRTKQPRVNMPYVEYLRSDEQNKSEEPAPAPQQQSEQRESRQRAVAKKSTAAPQPQPPQPTTDNVISRVVYYTPKNAVKPYKMVTHTCGPQCKRSDVLALKDLRTYNPLAKPLLSGWERQIVRFKGHKDVIYRAPCGRRLRTMRELHRYLRNIQSDMAVDLFDFAPGTHCLAEFVLNTCRVGKKDLSHGKENVPVPCVNYYDDSLPEFCSYNTERTPTAGVPLNLDPEFLCGCDCTDDCMDKKKCACWQMTLEGARTIGLQGPNVGYVYKRLPEPLPSGIYECNSRCKCKQTCLNRVAQHPLQLKLQVFKTLNRGWGIRALNDVPKGSFLCVYAGNLLTDATANMDGLNEGDEYLAELDYIEVVEQMKEGYEEDIPEADKKLDKKNQAKPTEDESEEEESSSEDDTRDSRLEKEDDDFRPPNIGLGVTEFSKRLRKRDKKKEKEDVKEKENDKEDKEQKEQKGEDDCITISDDEEVREPSRFTAQAGMQSNEFISKYRSVRSHFGEDEACYIMDAKVQGNIGRYLNHSCCPNVFVQNVFVDTHDPRFPWVAFFALCHIKAGTELTWNYNYDVGSVPGKVLYCYCGAPNCRGRLL